MKDKFERPALSERFMHLAYLLKHTATITNRDRDIFGPPIRMAVYALLPATAFFAAMWGFLVDADGTGMALLALSVTLFVYKFFYYNRQELALSWLVFETAAGRDRDGAEAAQRVSDLKPQARILALLDMGSAWIARQRRRGNKGMINRLLLSALTEGWDMINHFLLPAFAIEGVGFRDGMSRLKAARENVPETLMGVFGIDILGRLVASIAAPLYVLMAVFGIIAGTVLAPVLPMAFGAGVFGDLLPAEVLQYLPITAETRFNWLPLFICILVGRLLSAVFERLVTTLKVIYFTLFYARTLHADSLAEDIRAELDAYLRFSDREEPEDAAPYPA
ncbi:hypothetical protein NTH_00938 [Nitratireductor thuwali]|uniref:Uncharacterized protein n=2 Tax=Nitratireductor thuwali TaxID=2267699 RepID=A0ABY5MH48_9HYPH|nr:hypothetical protein NTH_00938 [Nitratireductor thuwali]